MQSVLLLLLLLLPSDLIVADEEDGDDDDGDEGFGRQRAFTTLLDAGREDCYFFETELGDEIDFEFMVLDSDPSNARPLDVVCTVKDGGDVFVWYQFRRSKEALADHRVERPGDYRICFKNRSETDRAADVSLNFHVVNSGTWRRASTGRSSSGARTRRWRTPNWRRCAT